MTRTADGGRPPADKDWEVVAAAADGLPDGWRRHAARAHLALLQAWVQAPTGRWLKTDTAEETHPVRALLPSLGSATWVGIDAAHSALRGAVGCARVQADVRRLPFPSGTFDGVLSTSTLDHFDVVSDIDVSLRELRRVLRPEGRLVLTLDNPRNPLIRLRNALPPAVRRRTGLVPFHVGPTLDVHDGAAALERAGFVVLDTAHLLHAPHVVGTRLAAFEAVESLLPRVDRWLGARGSAATTGHFAAFLAAAR